MRNFVLVIFILTALGSIAQTTNGYAIPDSLIQPDPKYTSPSTAAGTCASPDGNMNSIAAPPGSYTYLQNNGYCNPGSYGKTGTVCWSFTPSQPSVNINSGYSQTGCTSIGFGPFTLYRCAPSCSVVGTGLSYTVTPGQCYTWCMSWSASGPPSCSVNDWCPYYQQFTPLPIELNYFAGSNQGNANVLQWKTSTEKNNAYFVIEVSGDAENWNTLTNVNGAGTSNHSIIYSYTHFNFNAGVNYYRLKQTDLNGSFKYHGIVVIDNSKSNTIKVTRILNIMGQDVGEDYDGIKIFYYSDGSIEKRF